MRYILKNKKPVLEPNMLKWTINFEKEDRHVAFTETKNFKVSTVFLGLDHNFTGKGKPLLFETIVFDEKSEEISGFTRRYCSWTEAEQGHQETINKIKKEN